ncbi:hypothetical protein ACFSMW_06750 [Virgibacillus halophilus]|uniref:DUF4178 domain-containing protein n=1 Tax=Tigheibacillus halophilus TaxID=361280 RepID=A0ABU5C612_9BACI|nr:hypothetical protein [Virgibacillus halophilus]
MEKVKITQEQADAIEYFKEHLEPKLKGMLNRDLIAALSDGYEVEPEYQCGEWIAYKRSDGTTIIAKIVEVEDDSVLTDYQVAVCNQRFYFPSIRHATPSEIAAEKERRFWSENNRNTWELKENDVIYDESEQYATVVDKVHIDSKRETIVIFKDGEWEFRDNVVEQFKVLCFAESRLDRGDEHA